jgi:hypothetical protein
VESDSTNLTMMITDEWQHGNHIYANGAADKRNGEISVLRKLLAELLPVRLCHKSLWVVIALLVWLWEFVNGGAIFDDQPGQLT